MQSAAPAVISSGYIYFFVFLVYLTVSLFAFRYLLPGLSPVANRLAMFMLIAQMALVGLSIFLRPSSPYERWFWHLDSEYNLVSTLAAAQFALAGCLALYAGWFSPARPAWRLIYFAGIGILFLALAWDEYHGFRSVHGDWQIHYASLGLALASATLLVALRSPRRAWKWFFCLLSGLAIGAVGALILDIVPCNSEAIYLAGTWRVDTDGCLELQRIEEILELVGVWLALVAAGGLATIAARPIPRIMYLVPSLSILLLLLYFLPPLLELRLMTQEASIGFEARVNLQAFRADISRRGLDTTLFVSSADWHKFTGMGYSIHLVDQVSGKSAARVDENISRRHSWKTALYEPRVKYIQRSLATIPPDAPKNRAMWIVLTLWREQGGEFVPQRILTSDHPLLSDTQLILDELVLKDSAAMPQTKTALASFENGFALDPVELPQRLRASEPFSMSFTWRANEAGAADYIQFMHLRHEESGEWRVYDQQPLGPRLPTRLWYSGLVDSEVWQLPQSDDLPAGSYSVFTGLYDASDGERVIARDANGEPFLDSHVPLGAIVVQAA
ncbi:MAG: hypothetical protein J4G18_13310 [Anaerolineae bacterium]|nr:hypothetical protein [Anaerolineae bacterium]